MISAGGRIIGCVLRVNGFDGTGDGLIEFVLCSGAVVLRWALIWEKAYEDVGYEGPCG